MPRIFISYSRKDEEFTRKLASSLSDLGADIWIDVKDIPAGMKWSTAIQDGLKQCELMIVIITPDSMSSRNVEDEWQYFLDKGKEVVPVLWKPADDIHFQLSRIQYIDFHNQDYNLALDQLLPHMRLSPKKTTPATTAFPLLDWCEIPGKVIQYNGEHYRVPAFYMAKYPITNAQYRAFLDDSDGFRNPTWWNYSDRAQKWRMENPGPIAPQFTGDNCPREMVTWYEAMAYCGWLSNKLGKKISLPTEIQRVRVVQGDDQRTYPWGHEFDPTKCNTRESLFRRTTSVIKYPSGASQFGVMDLAGNVWEWSLTEHRETHPYVVGTYLAGQMVFGGGWRSRRRHTVSAYPRWYKHDYVGDDLGFRVCMEW
jgi:hypothetical protein